MGELKPCPFCGGNPTKLEEARLALTSYSYFIWCRGCDSGGPNSPENDDKGAARKEAVCLWNTRTQPDVAEQIAAYVEREAKGKFLPATILQLARDIRAGRWKGGE